MSPRAPGRELPGDACNLQIGRPPARLEGRLACYATVGMRSRATPLRTRRGSARNPLSRYLALLCRSAEASSAGYRQRRRGGSRYTWASSQAIAGSPRRPSSSLSRRKGALARNGCASLQGRRETAAMGARRSALRGASRSCRAGGAGRASPRGETRPGSAWSSRWRRSHGSSAPSPGSHGSGPPRAGP